MMYTILYQYILLIFTIIIHVYAISYDITLSYYYILLLYMFPVN